MSTGSHIVIKEGEDGIFRGYDRFMGRDYEKGEGILVFETKYPSLKDAILAAENYMGKNTVEFGYTFVFLPSIVDDEEVEKAR